MMALLSFSGEPERGPFWVQILEREKNQTVRPPRKRPIKPGEILHIYWKVRVPKDKKPVHKLGTANCLYVQRLTYADFYWDDAFAEADGFVDRKELQEWFGPPLSNFWKQYDLIMFGGLMPTEEAKKALTKYRRKHK